ncbi:MAG: GNVR domain-containing protein [Bacteroidales bacterium]
MTTQENLHNRSNTNKDEIDLLEVFFKIWKFRRFLFWFTAGFIILSVIYALLAKPQYEASVSLYKETQGREGAQGGIENLAMQFGFGGSLTRTSQFNIEDLIESRNINERIIYHEWTTEKYDRPVNLIEYWEIDAETEELSFSRTLEKLRNKLDFRRDEETGLMTITVEMPEPQLSADIANYIIDLITEYVQTERKTTTRENQKYLLRRLNTIEKELKEAEEEVKEFKENNREISHSPRLQMELDRLERQVNLKREVFLSLEQEREMTEVELVKETPVINVLDYAVKPEQRAKPKRKLIVIVAAFAGLFLSILLVVLRYVWNYVKKEMNNRGETLKLF